MEKVKQQNEITLIKIIIGVCLAWGVFGVISYFASANWTDRGTFGDMFGSINVLFSGLAFACVAYSVHIQQKALELQRNDIEIQRKAQELQMDDLKLQAESTAKSAEQLEAQQQLLKYQMVHQTVIELIKHKNDALHQNPNYIDLKALSQATDIFIYTLQYIEDSNISQDQKKVLVNMLMLRTIPEEVDYIYDINNQNQNQHNLLLLSSSGVKDIYEAKKARKY